VEEQSVQTHFLREMPGKNSREAEDDGPSAQEPRLTRLGLQRLAKETPPTRASSMKQVVEVVSTHWTEAVGPLVQQFPWTSWASEDVCPSLTVAWATEYYCGYLES
jgi:hypothetical protein